MNKTKVKSKVGEKEEIVELNDKYRILMKKVFSEHGWSWYVYMQQKFLFMWWTTKTVNDGWDYVYGYSYEEAKKKAEKIKDNLMRDN